jgi:hypothetical protein
LSILFVYIEAILSATDCVEALIKNRAQLEEIRGPLPGKLSFLNQIRSHYPDVIL